jgi:microcystin-dependent protein
MSFFRARNRSLNKTVFYDNRLNKFLNFPMRTGNLFVEKNETVHEDLTVEGSLAVGGDLSARNIYANKGNFYLDQYLLIPYGTIIQSASINVPEGWLLCNGASILKELYMNLFGAIGYTYGGNGNNFNVPDIRGRVAVGSGTGVGLTARSLAAAGGAETHVLTANEMPTHTHTSNANGGSIGLITSTGSNTQNGDVNGTPGEPDLYAPLQALSINFTGGGLAHNNMQPFIVFNYLIKY